MAGAADECPLPAEASLHWRAMAGHGVPEAWPSQRLVKKAQLFGRPCEQAWPGSPSYRLARGPGAVRRTSGGWPGSLRQLKQRSRPRPTLCASGTPLLEHALCATVSAQSSRHRRPLDSRPPSNGLGEVLRPRDSQRWLSRRMLACCRTGKRCTVQLLWSLARFLGRAAVVSQLALASQVTLVSGGDRPTVRRPSIPAQALCWGFPLASRLPAGVTCQ